MSDEQAWINDKIKETKDLIAGLGSGTGHTAMPTPNKKRILITGASGLLGANLLMEWRDTWECFGTYNHHSIAIPRTSIVPMDCVDALETYHTIVRLKPDIVVHCAAETRVDFCEQHQRQAWKVNVQGTEHVAIACAEAGAKLVYISTDSVFDGRKGNYSETDAPNPLNVYARTKLAGELAARQYGEALIVRTNIFGWSPLGHKPSLVEWVIDTASDVREVFAWSDVSFTPILVNELAAILEDLIHCNQIGTFHVGTGDGLSKYTFALMVTKAFRLNPLLIQPSHMIQSKLIAARPRDTSLVCQKRVTPLSLLWQLTHMRELGENGYLAQLRGGAVCHG